jgi:hypothetical protein
LRAWTGFEEEGIHEIFSGFDGCVAWRLHSENRDSGRSIVPHGCGGAYSRRRGARYGSLLPTLTHGEGLTMIAPDGQRFDTRQQYIDFHTQWFAAPDEGRLEVIEYARFIESAELGQVFLKYRYSFKDASGAMQSMVNWLTLTLALEEGAWRLVFDQNTPIESHQ